MSCNEMDAVMAVKTKRASTITAKGRDPALESLLKLLQSDISHGRRIHDLPASMVASLRRASRLVSVDLNIALDGDIEL
jgi:hypothetical protein